MNFDFENVTKTIVKHKKLLALGFVVILLFYLGVSEGIIPLQTSNIVNPGFEGAKCNAYGVVIQSSGVSSTNYVPPWTGLDTVHFVGNNENPIASAGVPQFIGESYTWGSGTGASQMTIKHLRTNGISGVENQITTDIESNIQLEDFNYQTSTPLAIPGTNDPTLADYIQYWHLASTSTITSSNSTDSTGYVTVTTTNSTAYTLTKQDILLVPGDFHIDISIVPSNANAGTGSGWQEGSFSNIQFWYMLSWYNWLNSLGSVVQNDPNPPTIPNGAINRNSLFNVRGGVPISAWIQNYYMPVKTDTGIIYDLLNVRAGTSGSTNTITLAGSQLAGSDLPANLLSNLKAMVENGLSPSLKGHYIDLYTQPSDQFTYVSLQPDNISAAALAHANSPVPDSQTELPNEYFKIGVTGLGTYVWDHGWFATPRYTVYYPTASYLIRVIMAVYGTHTYVWTVNTATQQGYNIVTTSPNGTQTVTSGWTDRTVQATTGGGISGPGWSWPSISWPDIFSPLNLELFAIAAIVIIALVTIFNPGVWSNILSNRKQGRVQSPKARGRKTPR